MTKTSGNGISPLTALQSRDAIELLADKWRISILHLLQNGAVRSHQLQKALEQVSPKMLTQTLRGLERDGLLNRIVYPGAPSRVEYELTRMGGSVIKPLQELGYWAEAHAAERDAARVKFDLVAGRGNGRVKCTDGNDRTYKEVSTEAFE